MTDKSVKMNKTIFYFALSFCILIFAFFTFAVTTAHAATLYFSPSSGNFTVGNIFTVNILVNTEGADINNAEATVNFPSGLLEIISISKSGSAFSLWVEEPRFSNSAGTLSFNGGLPTPGFKGTAGKVLGVVFRVKKAGPASLVFSSAAVRANDGYGTNVLEAMNGASFNINVGITPQPPVASPKIEAPVVVSGFKISSSTHPDSNKWYNVKDAEFSWDVPTGVLETKLALTRDPLEAPHVRYSPPISEKSLPDLENGVWYLNALFRTARGVGETSSFKFQIDTVSPKNFLVTRVDGDIYNSRPEIMFSAEDELSGINHYEIKINGQDWFNADKSSAGKSYRLPTLKPGEYEIQVKAVDEVGNFTIAPTVIISVVKNPNALFEYISNIVSKVFDYIINILSSGGLFIAFIIALVGLILALIELFKIKAKKLSKHIGDWIVVRRAQKKSNKQIEHIINDIEQEIKFLNSIGKRRRLSPEESYLKTKMAQYLKTLKDIKDLEDRP